MTRRELIVTSAGPQHDARALDGKVDWTDDREEGRRVFREELHKTLSALLRAAGTGRA